MNNTYLVISAFLSLFLAACTPGSISKQHIYTQGANVVVFTDIVANRVATGTKISGNVRQRSQPGKQITIPGHIHIISKDPLGKPLEIIQASTHRKYGNSKVWHFEGVLTSSLPEGSTVIVQYHKHPKGKKP